MPSYDHELTVALEAAQQAGQVILSHYATFEAIPDARIDISTSADRDSQEAILQHLQRAFPEDALCAEESTATLSSADKVGSRMWIVDPIDGTRGFAQKNGEFSVMVALLDQGMIAVGVVLEPALDRLTYAIRGGGCWRRDGAATAVACHVGRVEDLSSSTLVQSHTRPPGKESWQAKALGVAQVVETYSAGVKLAKVARGEVDIYVNDYKQFHDWDICAGHILVAEAGGKVTGLAGEQLHYGQPGAWQKFGLVACNDKLHPAVVQRLIQHRR